MGIVSMRNPIVSNLLGLVGAAIGGAVGLFTFDWIVGHGFYGLMIPGALLGLGCSMLAQHRSLARGIVCALAAIVLSLFSEWYSRPFAADQSLKFFLDHLRDLSPITWIMLAVGSLAAFWMGRDANPVFSGSDGPKPGASSKLE